MSEIPKQFLNATFVTDEDLEKLIHVKVGFDESKMAGLLRDVNDMSPMLKGETRVILLGKGIVKIIMHRPTDDDREEPKEFFDDKE